MFDAKMIPGYKKVHNKFKLNKNNDWQRNNYAWNLLFDFIIEISKDN